MPGRAQRRITFTFAEQSPWTKAEGVHILTESPEKRGEKRGERRGPDQDKQKDQPRGGERASGKAVGQSGGVHQRLRDLPEERVPVGRRRRSRSWLAMIRSWISLLSRSLLASEGVSARRRVRWTLPPGERDRWTISNLDSSTTTSRAEGWISLSNGEGDNGAHMKRRSM